MAGIGARVGGVPSPKRFGELKQRLLFVIGALIVYRIGTYIPVPGIDAASWGQFIKDQQDTIVGLFNVFSGGALERMSVFALNVMPYISASIIMQLLSATVPSLEQLKKEGEAGRRKITQYTRYGTVVLALFQSVAIAYGLQSGMGAGSAVKLVHEPGFAFIFVTMVTLVSGTMFLVWLGEQVTERGIGNGISLIIFAGIVAGLPSAIGNTLDLASRGTYSPLKVLILFAIAIGVTAFVVYVERGQRRITVNYAKRQKGRQVIGGQTSHLPLKLNMAGVIPPIFASSIILFPATLGTWFGRGEGGTWLQDLATMISPGQPLYMLLYASAIIFFCFFYTALTFNPKDMADNLKKSGAFIPGIRPGDQTARYIDGVTSRLTLAGAIYITLVCLIPEIMIWNWQVPFYFGGTSLLIIVVVSMDFMSQVQNHIMSHQYESLLKKANLTGGMGIPR